MVNIVDKLAYENHINLMLAIRQTGHFLSIKRLRRCLNEGKSIPSEGQHKVFSVFLQYI